MTITERIEKADRNFRVFLDRMDKAFDSTMRKIFLRK